MSCSRLPPLPATARGNVLLCVTGSVAAVRRAPLYAALLAAPAVSSVIILSTASASRFPPSPPLPPAALTLFDADEDVSWRRLGDPVLHIRLRDWADVLLLAPLSANTLAKLANGICDNLITCVARAWTPAKPVVVAPAMNTAMWLHPATARHMAVIDAGALGAVVDVVPPVEKTLACGDTGVGAMAAPADIAAAVDAALVRTGRASGPAYGELCGRHARVAERSAAVRVKTGDVPGSAPGTEKSVAAAPSEAMDAAPPGGVDVEARVRADVAAAVKTEACPQGEAVLSDAIVRGIDAAVAAAVAARFDAALDAAIAARVDAAVATRFDAAVEAAGGAAVGI